MLFMEIDDGTREAALQLSGTIIVSRGVLHHLGALPGPAIALYSTGKSRRRFTTAVRKESARLYRWTANVKMLVPEAG